MLSFGNEERKDIPSTDRPTVDTGRCNPLAIPRIDEPDAIPREMSSRSSGVSVCNERRRTGGAILPRFDNKN
jgi:hypothetical protein